jgi:hypothetical protein
MSLESILRAQALETVELCQAWSFTTDFPDFRDALAGTEPWLAAALDTLAVKLPIPETVGTFVARPFYRPPGSYRCFYYCPSSLHDEWPRQCEGHAVIAIKGLEPCTKDVDRVLRDFRRPSYSPHNILEHLIFEEQKIPAVLSLAEALLEARRAAEIQSAHLRVYGSLARLPFPLFVFRHSVEVERRILEMLRLELSKAALETVEPWITAGLGVYVYYYPTTPVRVRDVESLLQGLSFQQRIFALIGICDPEQIVRRWVCCFVRMLYLGMLPGALHSFRTGICCQPQNACIDGGFVDLDSLTPVVSLRDDAAVYAALQFSTESLLSTVRALVAGSTDATRPDVLDVRFDLYHLNRYVLAEIQHAIDCETRVGIKLDTRISRYYTPPRSFESLVNHLSAYYSSPNPAFTEAARKFNDFGLSLIAAARNA